MKTENLQQLCSTCDTGHEMLKLDPSEPLCPHLYLHDGCFCRMYVPMNMKVSSKIPKEEK